MRAFAVSQSHSSVVPSVGLKQFVRRIVAVYDQKLVLVLVIPDKEVHRDAFLLFCQHDPAVRSGKRSVVRFKNIRGYLQMSREPAILATPAARKAEIHR